MFQNTADDLTPTAEPPLLEIARVSKTFDATQALKDVSLNIGKSEIVALIGPSGSGKSTLLLLCNGLLLADRSEDSYIRFSGADVQRAGKLAPQARVTRSRIGFIFQSFNLVGRLSLLNNVMAGASFRTPTWRNLLMLFPKNEKWHAMEALAKVGLAHQASQRASTLSGGQQQRGAIARAIMQEAVLILADEPVASLDPKSSEQVMKTLLRLNRERGVTIVVTLHQVELAQRYCHRIVALNDGRIHFDGAPTQLNRETLESIYGPTEAFSLMSDADVHETPDELALSIK